MFIKEIIFIKVLWFEIICWILGNYKYFGMDGVMVMIEFNFYFVGNDLLKFEIRLDF